MSVKLDKGLVQIYTGDGKGKTTAAIGLAVRAIGRGLKVYMGQFMKEGEYGEHFTLEKLGDYIEVEQFGSADLQVGDEPSKEAIDRAKKGLEKISEKMASRDYDIIIADEICVAYYFDLLKLKDLMNLIDDKPEDVELIFTGRKAPEELIEKADLVTEMREIKHPYQKGIEAREGIEK